MRPRVFRLGLLTMMAMLVGALPPVCDEAGQADRAPRPRTLSHHGELKTSDGRTVPDAAYHFTFSLWTEREGGQRVWLEEHPVLPVEEGRFTALLGSTTPIDLDTSLLWLETEVEGDRLVPRVPAKATESCELASLFLEDQSGTGGTFFEAFGSRLSVFNVGGVTFYLGPALNNIISLTSEGQLRVSDKLVIPRTEDLSPSVGGTLVIGSEGGQNLAMDVNEIMARNNGAVAPLYLNHEGGNVYVNGAIVLTSDERSKKNIRPLEHGLADVMRLEPVSFEWADRQEERRAGLVAQNVRDVVKEAVYSDEEGTLGVAYDSLVPVLVRAIQDQQREIEGLLEMQSDLAVQNRRLLQEIEALRDSLSPTTDDGAPGRAP